MAKYSSDLLNEAYLTKKTKIKFQKHFSSWDFLLLKICFSILALPRIQSALYKDMHIMPNLFHTEKKLALWDTNSMISKPLSKFFKWNEFRCVRTNENFSNWSVCLFRFVAITFFSKTLSRICLCSVFRRQQFGNKTPCGVPTCPTQ